MLIRDALYKDMEFTDEEESIIDSEKFQDLRSIFQLGGTRFVYPSANHTRFEHSLGVCHMTKKLLQILDINRAERIRKKNKSVPEVWKPITTWKTGSKRLYEKDYFRLLPIAALLHDIGHIPSAHFLEEECRLFDYSDIKHDNPIRLQGLTEILLGKLFRKKSKEDTDAKQWVKKYLTAKKDSNFFKSQPRWIQQVITDTICADLLDYVRRDAFHLGKQDTIGYDDRLLRYFVIENWGEDKKEGMLGSLVIELVKAGEERRDAMNNLMDIAESRYALFEAVHLHHAKVAADAMLGKAIRILIETRERRLKTKNDHLRAKAEREIHKQLEGHGDLSLIEWLREKQPSAVEKLASGVKARHLYKRIGMWRNAGTGKEDDDITVCKQDKNANKDTRLIITQTEKKITTIIKEYIKIPKKAKEYTMNSLIIVQPSGFSAKKILDVPVKFQTATSTTEQIITLQDLANDSSTGVELLRHKYNRLQRIFIFAPETIRREISNLRKKDKAKFSELDDKIKEITQKKLGAKVKLFIK